MLLKACGGNFGDVLEGRKRNAPRRSAPRAAVPRRVTGAAQSARDGHAASTGSGPVTVRSSSRSAPKALRSATISPSNRFSSTILPCQARAVGEQFAAMRSDAEVIELTDRQWVSEKITDFRRMDPRLAIIPQPGPHNFA